MHTKEEERTMADLVGEYHRLVAEGAAVSDLRLQRLRERMTDEERAGLAARLGR
jgi:hypothetical protein